MPKTPTKSGRNADVYLTCSSDGTEWYASVNPIGPLVQGDTVTWWNRDQTYNCQISNFLWQGRPDDPFTQPEPIMVNAQNSVQCTVSLDPSSRERIIYAMTTPSSTKKQANVRTQNGGGPPIIIVDPGVPPTEPNEKQNSAQRGAKGRQEPELAGTGSKRR